ncbi:hypothetical protein [Hymenobacter baengnokdamensis]|uniref:hypothetical protein n=1 Tax=Hymenobacter baengnokdamensis TaxID=2615203 RepID=UPI0012490428|nr:hypothetical protein [Hymenobacter baengnokdamensis]
MPLPKPLTHVPITGPIPLPNGQQLRTERLQRAQWAALPVGSVVSVRTRDRAGYIGGTIVENKLGLAWPYLATLTLQCLVSMAPTQTAPIKLDSHLVLELLQCRLTSG